MSSSSLPVLAYTEQIKNAVANHDVTIIKADTGAGKSTQVPQILFEAGYSVVVTEPRRLAARTLAERVAEEMELELGGLVGYQTAFDHMYSKDTEILFCTDGLQLVRTLFSEYKGAKEQVLIIDEAHEWNLNIETLVAWCKRELQKGWKTKLIIMSATFEVEALADFFHDSVIVIDIPGRLFPVSMEETFYSLADVVMRYTMDRRNILVFVAGKKEITQLSDELFDRLSHKDLWNQRLVLPLHGELDVVEQKRCFSHSNLPKIIISTNVAQTSVTIDDIDVVIDSGEERRVEVENGIESLCLLPISQMDCLQRKGRAGRTKEGNYILCSNIGLDEREKYAVPEIQRAILDQVVLRLAAIHLDAETLDFFHQPSYNELKLSKENLTNMGALQDGEITDMGRRMAKIPLSCRSSRMLIEAERLHVVDDVLIITAILEIGSLLDFKNGGRYTQHVQEEKSDLLAELKVWKKFEGETKIDFKKEKLFAKNFFKVKELLSRLQIVTEKILPPGSTGDEKSILLACISGMAGNLYYQWISDVTNGEEHRQLEKNSCINGVGYVVGIPKTIEFKNVYGLKASIDLLTMVSRVTLENMLELVPHLIEVKTDMNCYYNQLYDKTYGTTQVWYKGQIIHSFESETKNDEIKAAFKKEEQERLDAQGAKDTLTIQDQTFKIYSRSFDPYIIVTEEELFTLPLPHFLRDENSHPIGIQCKGIRERNYLYLIKKLQSEKEKKRWANAKSFFHTAFTKKLEDILAFLSKNEYEGIDWIHTNGTIIVVPEPMFSTRKYGYVCLQLEQKTIRRTIFENEEKATECTKKALSFLFDKYLAATYPEQRFMQECRGKSDYTLFMEFVQAAQAEGCTERLDIFQKTRIELDEIFQELKKEQAA